MAAPALQPIVIWFGRVGDMILLSALLGVLHRRFGERCYVIGAGSWPAELYAAHADVARVECLRRYTLGPLDANWWRALRQLRARPGALPVPHTDGELAATALGGPPGELRAAHPAGSGRRGLPLAQRRAALRSAPRGRAVGGGRLRRLAGGAGPRGRAAGAAAARQPAHHARPAPAPRRRRRSRVAGRALGAAGAAAACAAAGGTHRAVRRTARGVAAAVDHAGGAPAGAHERGAAAAAAAGALRTRPQHDLGQHRAGASRRRRVAAGGRAVRRPAAVGVAAAQPGRLGRDRTWRPARDGPHRYAQRRARIRRLV